MNLIWAIVIILSSLFILINNSADYVTIFSESAESGISLLLSLAGIMAVWGGIMEIVERSGITSAISKILAPIINCLFPDIKRDKSCKNAVAMNITANILGLGNAATPLGIEAMRRMKAVNNNLNTATNSMVTFVIINTASIQIIPATTAVLRSKYGSQNPMSIVPAILAASFCSLIVGLIFDRVLRGKNYA